MKDCGGVYVPVGTSYYLCHLMTNTLLGFETLT